MTRLANRLRRALLCASIALLLPGSGWATAGAPVLRVLAWPGYADADAVGVFEKRYGVRVELTVVDSDAVLWQKISGNRGADFDVFAVNTAELQRYIDRELVQPVDPQAIHNTRRQLPRFRDVAAIAGLTRNGKVYGIPYTYAEMGLIYDRTRFAAPPASVAALWDPRYRGRVLAYDGGTHSFSLAALALGSARPFRLASGDWPRAVEKLVALRRNVLGFYTEPEESVRLFRKEGAVLMFANYGMQQVRLLRAAGVDVGYAIPREGALAWLDCWVISRGAQDRSLAQAWIDYTLEESVSGLLASRQGLSSTIAPSAGNRPEDTLHWLEPVEDVTRREALWGRIVSGDRPAKVLPP
jgi:putative spermidine/putrescine transport system substrate-binding protein